MRRGLRNQKKKNNFCSNVLHFIWERVFGLAPCHYYIIHNTFSIDNIIYLFFRLFHFHCVQGNNDLFITTPVHTIIDEFIWVAQGERDRLITNLETFANAIDESMQMIQQTHMQKWKQLEPYIQSNHKKLPCHYSRKQIIVVCLLTRIA